MTLPHGCSGIIFLWYVNQVNQIFNTVKMSKKYNLKSVTFLPRESSLTNLINNNQDVRSFMNLILAYVYRLSTLILVQYYFDRNVFFNDFNFVLWCINPLHIVLLYDILLHGIAIFILFPVVKFCYHKRELRVYKALLLWIIPTELVCLTVLTVSLVLMTVTVLHALVTFDMSPVLKFALMAEQVKMGIFEDFICSILL